MVLNAKKKYSARPARDSFVQWGEGKVAGEMKNEKRNKRDGEKDRITDKTGGGRWPQGENEKREEVKRKELH